MDDRIGILEDIASVQWAATVEQRVDSRSRIDLMLGDLPRAEHMRAVNEAQNKKRRRFTDEEVREMRLPEASVTLLAKRHGVRYQTIQKIRTRQTYKDVESER